jgi:hypothetical protein
VWQNLAKSGPKTHEKVAKAVSQGAEKYWTTAMQLQKLYRTVQKYWKRAKKLKMVVWQGA